MAEKASLPIGIEDYGRIRREGFYYVDKTRLIKDLLEHTAYVNLFTRPRRFGKTLNMSMLQYFFETGSDGTLFEGLEIAGEKELCDKYRKISGHFNQLKRGGRRGSRSGKKDSAFGYWR